MGLALPATAPAPSPPAGLSASTGPTVPLLPSATSRRGGRSGRQLLLALLQVAAFCGPVLLPLVLSSVPGLSGRSDQHGDVETASPLVYPRPRSCEVSFGTRPLPRYRGLKPVGEEGSRRSPLAAAAPRSPLPGGRCWGEVSPGAGDLPISFT